MKYFKEIKIRVNSIEEGELIIADFSEYEFEGIEETEAEIKIYIREESFDEEQVRKILDDRAVDYKINTIENKNWNEIWEAGFHPVIIDNKVGIRAKFHESLPGIQYEVIITPKMSFGTGHHATTSIMIRLMGQINFVDKLVLDFGTGTGVLAILAKKFGAGLVTATDHDEWSIRNAGENCIDNCCEVKLIHLDNINILNEAYDIVLANINLNVLSSNTIALKHVCRRGGYLLLSGFYENDLERLRKFFSEDTFIIIEILTVENWSGLLLQKKI